MAALTRPREYRALMLRMLEKMESLYNIVQSFCGYGINGTKVQCQVCYKMLKLIVWGGGGEAEREGGGRERM